MRWWASLAKNHKYNLTVNDEEYEMIKTYVYSQGKTLVEAVAEQVDYIVNNNIPIEKPVEKFLNIRERLIEKYGTIKEASKHTNVSYQTLMDAIHKIERNKNYKPQKSTSKMLMDLVEKKNILT